MAGALKDWETRIGRRLKLRDLHILGAVVLWGSMAKAAKHLSMTQPAVSNAIASLEHTLGVRLLDRNSKGVEATIYATALIKRGLVAFDELRQGIKDIEFLADPTRGEVRIGCPESLSAGLVPAIIERLSRRHPQITVYIVDAQPAATGFRELRERSVDLLLGRVFEPFSEDDVNMEVLCEDRFQLVVGARSPWARRRKITMSELIDEPWILYPPDNVIGSFVAGAFRTHGLDAPRNTVTTFSLHVRMHLLATQRFVTIMQESVLRYNAERWSLKALPIDLGLPRVPLASFCLAHRTLSPVVERFLDQVREVARKTGKTR